MSKRYRALAFVAGLYTIIGWLVAIFGVLGGVGVAIFYARLDLPNKWLFVGGALAGIPFSLLAGISIVAAGEWIDLHLELVANSRQPATLADDALDWAP